MKDSYSNSGFLSGLLSIFSSDDSDEKTCSIGGRDKEISKIIGILSKCYNRNALLVGPHGVGKTSIVKKLAWLISSDDCPSQLYNLRLLTLNVNYMIFLSEETIHETFNELVNLLSQKPELILFIDNIDILLQCKNIKFELDKLLDSNSTAIIATTTNTSYDDYSSLKSHFEEIVVHPPKSYEVYDLIKEQIETLKTFHNVSIEKEVIDFVILSSYCFDFSANPKKSIDILDKLIASVKIKNRQEVTKQDFFSLFDLEKFNNLEPSQLVTSAYHEAAHFIVCHFSEALSERHIISISIIPTEDYEALTYFETDESVTSDTTYEYYVQRIGSILAGKIAEEMYAPSITSGAYADLKEANNFAIEIISTYGICPNVGDRVFLEDNLISQEDTKLISEVNFQVNKLLKNARNHAKKLLLKKRHLLEIIANELINKYVLTKLEIEEILRKK